jgi:hypothetical protein
VVGGVAVWTAALGLVLGVGLVTGVGIVRQRVDVSALLDSPDSQPE